MSRMHSPSHPGAILREDILPALGLSITDAAAQLGVSRVAFSRVLHEHASISPELALRLEAWLSGGSDAEHWLAMQRSFDLWQLRQSGQVRNVIPAPKYIAPIEASA